MIANPVTLSSLYWGISWKELKIKFVYRIPSNQSRFPYLDSSPYIFLSFNFIRIITVWGCFIYKLANYWVSPGVKEKACNLLKKLLVQEGFSRSFMFSKIV